MLSLYHDISAVSSYIPVILYEDEIAARSIVRIRDLWYNKCNTDSLYDPHLSFTEENHEKICT